MVGRLSATPPTCGLRRIDPLSRYAWPIAITGNSTSKQHRSGECWQVRFVASACHFITRQLLLNIATSSRVALAKPGPGNGAFFCSRAGRCLRVSVLLRVVVPLPIG